MASDVCVLIPTIGRVDALRRCLISLRAGSRRPDETLVVAQGAWSELAALEGEFEDLGLRVVRDDGTGRGRALNVGLRSTRRDLVAITDDDCTVSVAWLARAAAELDGRPEVIVTGLVTTHGDPDRVPALKASGAARTLRAPDGFGRLAGGNMAADRRRLAEAGGFDERIVPAAEDNELCYRWLQTGGVLRYEPAMVVWHDDWRDARALRDVYQRYGRGQGRFYGTYLRAGDLRFLVLVLRDAAASLALLLRTVRSRRRPAQEPRLQWPRGFVAGLREALAAPGPAPGPALRQPWLRAWLALRLRNAWSWRCR